MVYNESLNEDVNIYQNYYILLFLLILTCTYNTFPQDRGNEYDMEVTSTCLLLKNINKQFINKTSQIKKVYKSL